MWLLCSCWAHLDRAGDRFCARVRRAQARQHQQRSERSERRCGSCCVAVRFLNQPRTRLCVLGDAEGNAGASVPAKASKELGVAQGGQRSNSSPFLPALGLTVGALTSVRLPAGGVGSPVPSTGCFCSAGFAVAARSGWGSGGEYSRHRVRDVPAASRPQPRGFHFIPSIGCLSGRGREKLAKWATEVFGGVCSG